MYGTLHEVLTASGKTPARNISQAFANGDQSITARARAGSHDVIVNAPVSGNVKYMRGWRTFSMNSESSLRAATTIEKEMQNSVSRHQAAMMSPGSRTDEKILNITHTLQTSTKEAKIDTLCSNPCASRMSRAPTFWW